MSRPAFTVWTPDFGRVTLDSSDDDSRLGYFLQEVLDQGLWGQFRRFPPSVVERLLPRLTLSPHRRRLLAIWVEEKARRRAS